MVKKYSYVPILLDIFVNMTFTKLSKFSKRYFG